MGSPLDLVSNIFGVVKGGVDFVFVKLPKKSIFPLLLLGLAALLCVVYLWFWYSRLWSV